MKKSSLKTCSVGPYKNCIVLDSGKFKIAVSQDFGPRVLGAWIDGGDNLFQVLDPKPMTTVDTGFTLYGGHRLWHSPEVLPRTYAPDNNPVNVICKDDDIIFESEVEALTGVQKRIKIHSEHDGIFFLTHELKNCSPWTIKLSPWALTLMAPGGVAVIPRTKDPDEGDQYTPDCSLVFWPYTKMTDKRILVEDDFILVKQEPLARTAAKIGFYTEDAWIAYINKGTAFVKCAKYFGPDHVNYPDRGCNIECYTCSKFCEIETLAPVHVLDPGQSSYHVELWQALTGLPEIKNSADVKKYLVPRL